MADPGDYHRGLTNALQMEKAPTHQAVDLMTIMPHVQCDRYSGAYARDARSHHHRSGNGEGRQKDHHAKWRWRRSGSIRVSAWSPSTRALRATRRFFKYARDLGNRRGDMYEIGLWEDSIVESGNDIMYAINIPQESVTIPETMDAIRAAMKMQLTRDEGTAETNRYLGIGKFKK